MYHRALRMICGLNEPFDQKEFVATLYHNLGGIEHARRRFALGLRYARRGIEIRKTVRPRDTLALAADEAALAAILSELGRASEAVVLSLRVLHQFRRSLGPKHCDVGFVLANLGCLYWRTGRPHSAERLLRHAVSILEEALGRTHPRTAIAVHNLALVCTQRRKLLESGMLYRRAVRILAGQPRWSLSRNSDVSQSYEKSPPPAASSN
jgi:tetratricopeptide (TPR) repeat protein